MWQLLVTAMQGSVSADYPPPLIPLEPYDKPTDPFGPPALLPQLCPPVDIVGCTYNKQGSFQASDIIPLPGRAGDPEVPAVNNWDDFLAVSVSLLYTMPGGLQWYT